MRKHSVANSKVPVLDALFPSIRQHILATILGEPARWWYLSELAHHLGTTPSSLQRELPLLVNAGILEERRNGTRTYFRAQQVSPTFRNLRGIFAKTQEDRKKSQSPVPKRLSGLPLVSRVATRPPLPSVAKVEHCTETARRPGPPRQVQKRPVPTQRAKKGGTLKPGRAMKVMVYPRPKIKAVLVEASRKAGLSLSSFIIRASAKRAAKMRRRKVTELIPADEWAQYV